MARFTPKPSFTFTQAPPQAVLDYLAARQLKPSFDYRDVWKEEHVAAFTVAKATSLDVLATFKEAVARAETEGIPFRQFQAELQPQLEKMGWWGRKEMVDPKAGAPRLVQLGSPRRLRVIYRTNLAVAHSAGRWERLQRTKVTRPYLSYRLGPSAEHREQHAAWEGLTLPVDASFWATHYPPNGWGCKCYVRALTRTETKEGGGPSKPPRIRRRRWKNKRTGKTEWLPEGIDPGWNYNPGRARMEMLQRAAADKLRGAGQDLATAAVRDWVASGSVERFLAKPKGDLPVMVLKAEVAQAIGTSERVTLLSAETAGKQLKAHPELAAAEYQMLPELGANPTVAIQDGENTAVLVRREGRLYFAAVKAARGGAEETYLTSFHRTYPAQVRRMLQRGRIIYGKWEE